MKKSIVFILCLVFMMFFLGCNKANEGENIEINKNIVANSDNKIIVKVTNYPLYFFTKQIAGDELDVQNLLPPGVDPHSYEPTPRDMIGLEKAGLLIYNGAGLEDWIVNISQTLDNKKLRVLDASVGIELIGPEEDEHEHDHDHTGEFDPHIWLDPLNSKKVVSNILETLIVINPQKRDAFMANAQQLIEQLDNLDKDYKEQLENSKKKVFVVNHAAFGYLANRYGLQQRAVMGVNPHMEPTPQKAAELVKLMKEYDLKCIFTETLVSSKVAEVLANEVGISTKVLNPLGNLTEEEFKAGKDYFSIMYENLASLKEGLE